MPDPSNTPEKDLLARVAQGSEAAFRELFHTYRGKLFGYIYNMTASRETAEDTVHDVFLKIWENRENLRHIDNLNAYLHRMAHNRAYSGFRRMAKETLILAELRNETPEYDSGNSDTRIQHKEVKTLIHNLVKQLSPQQRQVFLLSREEGLRQDAIAGRMGISVSTVKNHLAAAIHFLRDEIGRTYGPQSIAIFVIFGLS
jgi:RNA polymerase sigma-70 factor (family 1)